MSKNSNKKYYKTKKGLITRMYGHQKEVSKKRKYPLPNYTKEQFSDWIMTKDIFHKLFKNWEDSNFDADFTPSIDRKDDYISYTLNNIQITTALKNKQRYHKDSKDGTNRKKAKPVFQYNLHNKLIKKHYSINSASRETNTDSGNIARCCNGSYSQTNGFIWRWKND